jgi:hypothetical protein
VQAVEQRPEKAPPSKTPPRKPSAQAAELAAPSRGGKAHLDHEPYRELLGEELATGSGQPTKPIVRPRLNPAPG